MRNIFIIALALILLSACNSKPKTARDIDLSNFKHKISYAIGADMGANFANIPDEIYDLLDKEQLSQGFYDLFTDENATSIECYPILQSALGGYDGIDTSEYTIAEISHCYGGIFGEELRKSLVAKDALDQIDQDLARIGFEDALEFADTIIELEERQKMVMDFNNDMNKAAGIKFFDQKKKEYANELIDQDYVMVTHKTGNGESVDLTKEYKIVYTMTTIKGDTIISTVRDISMGEEANAQIVNADDIVFPNVWKFASDYMQIEGDYSIYATYESAYGEDGLRSPTSPGYIIQPYAAIVIHSKILAQNEKYFDIKERGRKLIAETQKLPNTITDPSGFVLTTLEEGTGRVVPEGGDVQAHYVLTNSRGELVENSYMSSAQYQQPAPTFSLKNVVRGWQLGIPKMRVGGRYKLVLPYDLAYGEMGNQNIEPYETLSFEIEIIDAGEAGSLARGM